jgi:shikimate dehydrogenase
MGDTVAKAFVVGHPIAHSRSPLIHGFWLARYGIAGSYERVDVAPEDFDRFLRELPMSGYVGGNVTIPHKEAAFAAIAHGDATAKAIGAVNTIWLEDGAIHGSNTDAYGFAANMDDKAPQWREADTACVLGAGGAARAILFALKEAGIGHIRLVNRSRSRAEELARRFGPGISVHGWDGADAAIEGTGLLVNTTSLGMGGIAFPELDLARLQPGAVVSDIVYAPLVTPLLDKARKHGFATVDGLGMLLHQAVPGFERWFGRRPEVDEELRHHVLADMGIPA